MSEKDKRGKNKLKLIKFLSMRVVIIVHGMINIYDYSVVQRCTMCEYANVYVLPVCEESIPK